MTSILALSSDPTCAVKSPSLMALSVDDSSGDIDSSLAGIFKNMVSHKSMQGVEGTLVCWFKRVKEVCGDEIFTLVSNPVSYKKACSTLDAVRVLQRVVEIEAHSDQVGQHLQTFYKAEIDVGTLLKELDGAKQTIGKKKYPEKEVKEVLAAFSARDGSLVSKCLAESELLQIEKEYEEICRLGKELESCGIEGLVTQVVQIRVRCATQSLERKDKLVLIAIAREAIRITFGISPYSTQVLALLGILNHPDLLKGRIAQVRTGEGKSVITTMLAFYNACQGRTVDIISSSRYLAQRDQEKYENFFKIFGIASSHICKDNPNKENFNGQIIYGTNFDFEFAVMHDFILDKGLRKITVKGKLVPRPFDVVIVDEVDNLLIDSALNSARIAITGKAKFGWIYNPILTFVRTHKERLESLLAATGSTKDDLTRELICELKKEIASVKKGNYKEIIDNLKSRKLEKWLLSAYSALYQYRLNEDYVIKPVQEDNFTTKPTRNHVVIVDKRNTGRLQEKSRWQYGIHEFLEAKHDLLIEEEHTMPASLSHPVFFGYYSKIFGLSGTMGGTVERREVENLYKVDTFDAPPHKMNQRITQEPKIHYTYEEHFAGIVSDIKVMREAKRATLILFESIQESNKFAAHLKEQQLDYQLLNEQQTEDEDFIVEQAGLPMAVTIATNTAGRGTDIILHPTCMENGGLHVIFTFYPKNERVEQQGFGRAARQGQPGSARMIVHVDSALLQSLSKELEVSSLLKSVLLGQLQGSRDKSLLELSLNRVERTAIEMIKHSYLQPFFERMQICYAALNDEFLIEMNRSLVDRIKKIDVTKLLAPIGSDLDPAELEFNKIFRSQVSDSTFDGRSWISFFQNIRSHLQATILQNWAEFFYDQLDDMYELIKKENNTATLEAIQAAYRQELDKQYLAVKSKWEEYLVLPKEGFIRYVERIMGMPL